MIELVMKKMILYSDGEKKKKDIAHFIKVHNYARTIGLLENVNQQTLMILEISAIVHDIACPLCRKKYGNSLGHYQELEGPALVRDFLKEFDLEDEIVDRVAFLVGHHHTYANVEGMDYQILLEADFLVNADESHLDKSAILKMKENVFQTKSGKELLDAIYDL